MMLIIGLSSESKVRCWWFVFLGSSSAVTKVQRGELMWIENASESDPRTCEATKAVVKKTHKCLRNIPRNIWPSYDDLLLYTSIVNSGQLPF